MGTSSSFISTPATLLIAVRLLLSSGLQRYLAAVAQWRIELSTQDVVALSRGEEITVAATDEEQDVPEESIEVTVALLEY
jgi:hypothetical protein